jgi:anti-sigma factor RsiW
MNPDQHFVVDAWVDFARGLYSPAQRTAMEEHRTTCQACSEMAKFFEKVWEVGHSLQEDTVPQDWSQKAKQILSDQTLAPIRQLPAYAAVLAFDSSEALTPEHVRTGHSSRHIIYRALDCNLELAVDRNTEQRDLSITGQITDCRTPDRAVPSTPVFLLAGNKVLASTTSNEFGEFQLAFKPKRKMRISFPFDGSRIDVILDRLIIEE